METISETTVNSESGIVNPKTHTKLSQEVRFTNHDSRITIHAFPQMARIASLTMVAASTAVRPEGS